MILQSIIGKTFRSMLAMIIALMIRLLVRMVTFLPQTDDSLWNIPEGITFFFTFDSQITPFFSAGIAVSTIFACEC